MENNIYCPECRRESMIKYGTRFGKGRKLRKQYHCQKCGRTTIYPIIKK